MNLFTTIVLITAAIIIIIFGIIVLGYLLLEFINNKKSKKNKKEEYDKVKYVHWHENPAGNNVGDCAIRAIATLTNNSWDNVFNELVKIAKKEKMMPNTNDILKKYLTPKGYIEIEEKKTVNIKKYFEDKKGTYLVYCYPKKHRSYSSHAVFIKDGVIFDTYDSRNYIVSSYFMKLYDNKEERK